ncbi:hypothetical protein [Flavobacterium sp. GP15]|uniref:hypothetical protein n=1 Tax=Flavobacterium sp. GP15 TaxID=2758567 RepID=UPI00165D6E89|nr:hypothetical protein [Flavobacterium sp. GP15]
MKKTQFVETSLQDFKNKIITQVRVVLDIFFKNINLAKPLEYLSRKLLVELFGVNT